MSAPTTTPEPTDHWRIARGAAALVLGALAVIVPFALHFDPAYLLGGLLLASATLELAQGYATEEHARRNIFVSGTFSGLAGLLLLAAPVLMLSALLWFLAISFFLDAGSKLLAARSAAGKSGMWLSGLLNLLIGALLVLQWPFSGPQALRLYLGVHIVAAGWSILASRDTQGRAGLLPPGAHPDRKLGLAPNSEVGKLLAEVEAQEQARLGNDVYWHLMFLATFFAIHVGRMQVEWNLVSLVSPLVAVVGDVFCALLLAFALVTPLGLGWRKLSRPVERRAWGLWLGRREQGHSSGLVNRALRWWLVGRMRFDLELYRAYWSPVSALRRGLQVGLPLTAILIATNVMWGFSWYFNTENWATGFWEKWVEYRVDDWRTEMVRAVRADYPEIMEAELLRVAPEGIQGDFSFLVLGDTGEGDASQHVLRDQFLRLGERPEMKFMVIASDVIYPAGAMRDYEPKFYLPFKGFAKPIYAVPGNHDWYDALEGFVANFLEPRAARAALRARVDADHQLTTTTERRIATLLEEAARLRREYGVPTGGQRAPYFELHADRFVLIVVDTGILRTADAEQLAWLRAALGRAKGKFTMAILGHPLYAGGHYLGQATPSFAEIHRLLTEHGADVVMAGDTHDFEHYREPNAGRTMYHFVNGGGGAYLSIGTALSFPHQPPVPDCAFYPRRDELVAKLDAQTPRWKEPLWFWVKQLGAWPSSPEALAGAFDFNRAPFFQSFVEVRVEPSARRVRFWPYGVHGRLRWRELQRYGQIMPDGASEDEAVEFTMAMP